MPGNSPHASTFTQKLCREISVHYQTSFPRVMPTMHVRSHYNSFWKLCQYIPVRFHSSSFESYVGNARTPSLNSFLRTMPDDLYVLTQPYFESYAGESPVR